MRLATFKANGRVSYGAVTDGGIIDLGRKLAKYPTLLDLLRAQAIAEASAAAKGPADYQLKDVEMLPPIPTPDKNICVGINYPERSAEYKDGREAPKYPNLFCRFPTSIRSRIVRVRKSAESGRPRTSTTRPAGSWAGSCWRSVLALPFFRSSEAILRCKQTGLSSSSP